MKRQDKVNISYVELMNVLNRAQELIVLRHELIDAAAYDKCMQRLERALAELGRVHTELPVNPEAAPMRRIDVNSLRDTGNFKQISKSKGARK